MLGIVLSHVPLADMTGLKVFDLDGKHCGETLSSLTGDQTYLQKQYLFPPCLYPLFKSTALQHLVIMKHDALCSMNDCWKKLSQLTWVSNLDLGYF